MTMITPLLYLISRANIRLSRFGSVLSLEEAWFSRNPFYTIWMLFIPSSLHVQKSFILHVLKDPGYTPDFPMKATDTLT
jgi:hypothetical protein